MARSLYIATIEANNFSVTYFRPAPDIECGVTDIHPTIDDITNYSYIWCWDKKLKKGSISNLGVLEDIIQHIKIVYKSFLDIIIRKKEYSIIYHPMGLLVFSYRDRKKARGFTIIQLEDTQIGYSWSYKDNSIRKLNDSEIKQVLSRFFR